MWPLGIVASSVAAEPPAPVGTYRDEVMADAPAAFYRLNDTATPAVDATGTTTQNTIGGVTFGAAGLGDGTTAATFDGTTGIVTNATSNLNGVVALEALFNVPALGANHALVSIGGSATASERHMLRVSSAGAIQFFFFGNTTVSAATGAVVTAGATYHVVGLVDAGTLRIYVNGSAAGTTPAAPTSTQPSACLALGYRAAASGGATNYNPLTGRLAGCAAYTTAPSPTRILVHARAAGLG